MTSKTLTKTRRSNTVDEKKLVPELFPVAHRSHPVVKSQWALWLLSSPLDFFGNFFSVKNSRFLRNLSETGDAVRRTRRTDPKPKQRPPPPKKSRKLPKVHSFDLRPVAVLPRSWQQAINKLHDLLLGVYQH